MNTFYIKDAIVRAVKTGAQAAGTILAANGAHLFTVGGHDALIIISGSTLASLLMSIQGYPTNSSAAYKAGQDVK